LSPVANLYTFCHLPGRDILKRSLQHLPIPTLCKESSRRIADCAKRYISKASQGTRELLNPSGYSEAALKEALVELGCRSTSPL